LCSIALLTVLMCLRITITSEKIYYYLFYFTLFLPILQGFF